MHHNYEDKQGKLFCRILELCLHYIEWISLLMESSHVFNSFLNGCAFVVDILLSLYKGIGMKQSQSMHDYYASKL